MLPIDMLSLQQPQQLHIVTGKDCLFYFFMYFIGSLEAVVILGYSNVQKVRIKGAASLSYPKYPQAETLCLYKNADKM